MVGPRRAGGSGSTLRARPHVSIDWTSTQSASSMTPSLNRITYWSSPPNHPQTQFLPRLPPKQATPNHPPQWRPKRSYQTMTMALHPGEVHGPSTPPSISSTYVPARELPLGMTQVSCMGSRAPLLPKLLRTTVSHMTMPCQLQYPPALYPAMSRRPVAAPTGHIGTELCRAKSANFSPSRHGPW